MGNYKKAIAKKFSELKDLWKIIYDPKQEKISKCLSLDMIKRKTAGFDLLDKYTNKGSLYVLDAGCGPGIFMEEAMNRGHHVVGVDISELMILQARNATKQKNGQITLCVQGDIEYLPFKNDSFHAIFCMGVLSYLPEDAECLRELHRVAKKDGFVIVGLPNMLRLAMLFDPYYYLQGFIFLWKKVFRDGNNGNESVNIDDFRRYFVWQLPVLFRSFNLRILEVINIGFGPMTIWKKEIMPEKFSLRVSQLLEKLVTKRSFFLLKAVANHWVVCLQKLQD